MSEPGNPELPSTPDPASSETMPDGAAASAPVVPGASGPPPDRENMWLSLACNIFLPVIILKKAGKMFEIADSTVLVIALAFPVGYFIWDFVRRKKLNWISVLGFVSVLLTGGIGLLKLPPHWFWIKEAAIPFAIGIATFASMFTAKPLIRLFMLNRTVMDVDRIEASLTARNTRASFYKLLRNCTAWLGGSFMLSAVLNFVLAKWIVKTDPAVDLEAFNDQVGTMTFYSYFIIMIPSMAILMFVFYKVMGGLKRDTGLELEDVMWAAKDKVAKDHAAKE